MIKWEYIIVQAFQLVDVNGIGQCIELVHNSRVSEVGQAKALHNQWIADGYIVSVAGKIEGEDGERLVTDL